MKMIIINEIYFATVSTDKYMSDLLMNALCKSCLIRIYSIKIRIILSIIKE